MEATHTALVIEVPAAEPAVGTHRATLDRAASWGVPAHITLVFPFLPPDQINDDALTAVREIVAAEPAFTVTLARVEWFGDTVVWLAPDPDRPFIALTAALAARFPQAQPYGGAFGETVPHLTIGHDHPRPVLEAATTVTAVHLLAGIREPGHNWHRVAEFPLGP